MRVCVCVCVSEFCTEPSVKIMRTSNFTFLQKPSFFFNHQCVSLFFFGGGLVVFYLKENYWIGPTVNLKKII